MKEGAGRGSVWTEGGSEGGREGREGENEGEDAGREEGGVMDGVKEEGKAQRREMTEGRQVDGGHGVREG